MKKTLMIAGLMSLLLVSTVTFAADTAQTEKAVTNPTANNEQIRPPRPPKFDKQKMEEFQNKLGLTDEQKAKAKLIHEQGREQMKPVMDKMMAKHEAIKAIKENTALTEEQKTAQIEQQVKELKALKQHSRELREKNMKEFENILTKDQKKTLTKMKEEGRKNFDKEFRKNHKDHKFGPEFGPRPDFEDGRKHPLPIKPELEEK